MTFLMSIVWIMVFSYLMVWWTTVIGNFAGILLHDLLTNRHYPLKSKYNQYKADKANKTNPMDKIFLMINVYKASIYHSIFSSKSQLFTNPFNLSFPMMHRENGNLNKKIEDLQVAPTHFCHVPGFYLTTWFLIFYPLYLLTHFNARYPCNRNGSDLPGCWNQCTWPHHKCHCC